MYIKRKAKRRLNVWGLIFLVILTAITQTLILPCSAKVADGMRNAGEAVESKVSNAANDVESKVEEIVTDAESKINDSSDGKVKDTEGIIGNETDSSTHADGKISKVGQIALIVLAVAAIIAVVIIVTVTSNNRKK